MINNFHEIESFIKFEPGSFYRFEVLVRNTDGHNILHTPEMSNRQKNILIKSYYVESQEYLDSIKHEMIQLATVTGARIYMSLDRKNNLKLIQELAKEMTSIVNNTIDGTRYGIKSLSNLITSKTSVKEVSDKNMRTIMFDVDTRSQVVLRAVRKYITNSGQIPYVLDSKQGYHVFCYKKFDNSNWKTELLPILVDVILNRYEATEQQAKKSAEQILQNYVNVEDNRLALVYHPAANCKYTPLPELPFKIKEKV